MIHRLGELARNGRVAEFEEVWLEAVEKPESAGPYLDALAALPSDVDPGQRRALLSLLADSFAEHHRHDDAAATLMALVEAGETSPVIRPRLLAHLRASLGEHRWCEAILDESGLAVGLDLAPAVARFRAMLALRPGRAVEHRGGWGIGVVRSIDERVREYRVEFVDGRKVDLPFESALEVLDPLPEDDYRALRHTDLPGLERKAREDAGSVLHALARTQRGGRLTAAAAKKELCGSVVPEGSWACWWKAAKQAAARHPYLSVEGGSRPVIVVRDGPLSPQDAARDGIRHAPDLPAAVTAARNIIATDPDPDTLAAALDALACRLEDDPGDSIHFFEARLLLAAHGHEKGEAGPLLELADREDASAIAKRFDEIKGLEGRRLVMTMLLERRPDTAPALLTDVVRCLRSEAVDGVIEFLTQRKASDLLVVLEELLAQPSKAPWVVFHLGRRAVAGRLGGCTENLLAGSIMALLQLYESQSQAGERGDASARALSRKIDALFVDPRLSLARRFGEICSREAMTQALAMVRSSRHLPASLAGELRQLALERFEGLVEQEPSYFWEADFVYTTRAGLERKRAVFRELTEERIPQNSRDIGRAAGHGDLSENAEWEAAMEEQRQLTRKAAEIEKELQRWRALEDQAIPDGVVAPGCRVSYEVGGKLSVMTILGPWDAGQDGVISYLAPLAGALLGKKPGDHVIVRLPSGEIEVVVQGVEKVI